MTRAKNDSFTFIRCGAIAYVVKFQMVDLEKEGQELAISLKFEGLSRKCKRKQVSKLRFQIKQLWSN